MEEPRSEWETEEEEEEEEEEKEEEEEEEEEEEDSLFSAVADAPSLVPPLTVTLAPTRMVVNKCWRVHRLIATRNVCGYVADTKIL